MSRGEIIDIDHIGGDGGPEEVKGFLSEWKTIRAVFHDFESLPHKRGDSVPSKAFHCHGHRWRIVVDPGGSDLSDTEQVYISVYLHCDSVKKSTRKVKALFLLNSPSENVEEDTNEGVFTFRKDEKDEEGRVADVTSNNVYHDFVLRRDVLDPSKNILVDGNLTIDASIQVELQPNERPKGTPRNLHQKASDDMIKLLEAADAETTDVHFEVQKKKRGKKTTIHAHRLIIAARAPLLGALLEGGDSTNPCVVPIQNTDPDLFRDVLRFIYGGEIPDRDKLKEYGQDLINIANRFGCTGLKHAAEAELAYSAIEIGNCAELILFADAKNCALLKECAVEFFVANATAVMKSEGFAKLKESAETMQELMEAGFGSKKRAASDDDPRESAYKRMRVGALRQKLDDKGLDPDGSREVLISRLKGFDTK